MDSGVASAFDRIQDKSTRHNLSHFSLLYHLHTSYSQKLQIENISLLKQAITTMFSPSPLSLSLSLYLSPWCLFLLPTCIFIIEYAVYVIMIPNSFNIYVSGFL